MTTIKKVITRREDRFRAPYEDRSKDHPRQCIFVGSTNDTQWQRDYTGGRRFWPIRCRHFNLKHIKQYREQYFAEALQRLKDGESWFETPRDQTLVEQELRRQNDEWEDIVRDWLCGGVQGLLLKETTIREVAVNCLKIDDSRLDLMIQRRIGKVLRTL